jgi:hypothetical protein
MSADDAARLRGRSAELTGVHYDELTATTQGADG